MTDAVERVRQVDDPSSEVGDPPPSIRYGGRDVGEDPAGDVGCVSPATNAPESGTPRIFVIRVRREADDRQAPGSRLPRGRRGRPGG